MSDQAPPSEHDQLAHIVEVELPALEARVRELEAALQRIATFQGVGDYFACTHKSQFCNCVPRLQDIARAALAASPVERGETQSRAEIMVRIARENPAIAWVDVAKQADAILAAAGGAEGDTQ